MRRHLLLEEVVSPVVTGLGCVLWGLQYMSQGKHSLIRLYIDKPEGVTIDDCERVSRQVDAVLGVKRLVSEGYTLEVSSPGMDRLLFKPEQYVDYIGKRIALKLIAAKEGRRNFKGILREVQENGIVIEIETGKINIDFSDITEARLVPFEEESDKGDKGNKGKKEKGAKERGLK